MFFLRKTKLYLTIKTILSLFLALSRLMTHNILQCIKKKNGRNLKEMTLLYVNVALIFTQWYPYYPQDSACKELEY